MEVPIETDRLLLRPFELGDAEQIHEAWSDPDVRGPVAPGLVESLEDTRATIEHLRAAEASGEAHVWAVVRKDTQEVIGDCGMFSAEEVPGALEIAYRYRRSAWGNGYATEAAKAMLRYGFDELRAPRVVADVDKDNAASARVLEKIGMAVVWTDVRHGREVFVYAVDRPRPGAG